MSFLEMLDVVNEDLTRRGEEPIAFESDCREGSAVRAGCDQRQAHGPLPATTVCSCTCDLSRTATRSRSSRGGPRHSPSSKTWSSTAARSTGHPIWRLRLGLDRRAPDGNAIPIRRTTPTRPSTAAACIGCGACVAACKNASAMLFVAAKVSHLSLLPQGKVEQDRRVLNMVSQMDAEGFGDCTT